jgi:hypothetical protein
MSQIEILTSMTGISVITAIAVIADIFDISRFRNSKHFASYLRSTPRVESSNGKTIIKSTTKARPPPSITLLSQSLNHFRDSNQTLMHFSERAGQYKKKGVIRKALCRRVITQIYKMLKKTKLITFAVLLLTLYGCSRVNRSPALLPEQVTVSSDKYTDGLLEDDPVKYNNEHLGNDLLENINENTITISLEGKNAFGKLFTSDDGREYIRIEEMEGLYVFPLHDIELNNFAGVYTIAEILNGNINVGNWGFDDISEIDIQMVYNEDARIFHIKTNFPFLFERERRLPQYEHIHRFVQIIAADGQEGYFWLNVYFTDIGIVLNFHDRKYGVYHYRSNILWKRLY